MSIKSHVLNKCTVFILNYKNRSTAVVIKATGDKAYRKYHKMLCETQPELWAKTKWTEIKELIELDGSMTAYSLDGLEIVD